MPASIPPFREKKAKVTRPNRWAIGFILFFFISALVLLFFQSPLSKIQHIEIKGQETLEENEIAAQVSLAPGVQFFEWDREKAEERLRKYPQVKDVAVTKIFPGKVVITLSEWRRVALWLHSDDGSVDRLHPVLENGSVLDEPWDGKVDKPLLRGWEDVSKVKALSQELAKVEPETLRTLSEIHPHESDLYDDEVRVFTEEGNEVITRISTFRDNIAQYRKFIPDDAKGIVHMTYSEDFGWFEPYVKEDTRDEEQGSEADDTRQP